MGNVCCGDGLYGAGDSIVSKAPNRNDAKKTNATASHNTLLKQQEERGENHEYLTRAQDVIKGTVIMFSGCQDSQTSADVSDVTSFGLPTVSAAEKAGGACTNGLLSTLKESPYLSFGDLLTQMQEKLKKRGYTQIPQLSSSRPINLKEQKFSVKHPSNTGSTRALLIGINYKGHKQGELDGCVNDAKMMRNYLLNNGYSPEADSMRMLVDESCPEQDALPTADNIVNGMNWLVGGALPGDSLFLHYSGHGGQAVDSSGGDEEDGMDETLVPLDYQDAGQIIDDTIYQLLVAPLPRGVNLVCVFDCCHSGTILDLPFIFSATAENVAAVKAGDIETVNHNAAFSFSTAAGLLEAAKNGVFNQLSKAKHKKPVVMALASKVASTAGSAASSAASTVKLLGGSLIKGGSLQNALSLLSKGGKPGAVAARGGDFKANVARAVALQGDDVVFEKVMQPDSLPGTPLRGPAADPDSLDSSFSSIGSRNYNNNNSITNKSDMGEMSSFASSSAASLGNVMIQEKAGSESTMMSGSLSRPARSPSTSSLSSSTSTPPTRRGVGTPTQSDSDDDGL